MWGTLDDLLRALSLTVLPWLIDDVKPLCWQEKLLLFPKNNLSCYHLLLPQQNGADVNLLDADKRSPLFYARSGSYQDIISVLLAHDCQDDAQSPLSSDTGSTELTQTA